jgi:hypothetical protein
LTNGHVPALSAGPAAGALAGKTNANNAMTNKNAKERAIDLRIRTASLYKI